MDEAEEVRASPADLRLCFIFFISTVQRCNSTSRSACAARGLSVYCGRFCTSNLLPSFCFLVTQAVFFALRVIQWTKLKKSGQAPLTSAFVLYFSFPQFSAATLQADLHAPLVDSRCTVVVS